MEGREGCGAREEVKLQNEFSFGSLSPFPRSFTYRCYPEMQQWKEERGVDDCKMSSASGLALCLSSPLVFLRPSSDPLSPPILFLLPLLLLCPHIPSRFPSSPCFSTTPLLTGRSVPSVCRKDPEEYWLKRCRRDNYELRGRGQCERASGDVERACRLRAQESRPVTVDHIERDI